MKLSVGTNFDDALIDQLKDTPVSTLYGKLAQDIFGGGRPSFALPQASEEQIQRHIRLAHDNGIEFNYLLNTVCMDNMELTKETNREIIRFLDKLKEWNVDWVTVSMPYLIDLVKKQMPDVKISVSLFADINSIQKAKYYESLGVDEITLPESFNRNFRFLEQLKKSVSSIDIRLIATNDCTFSCPYQNMHPIYQSHASQENHKSQGYPFDYCLLKCTYEKLKDPSQYIKSWWIRPEDVHIYEGLGYHSFKLTERLKKTDKICKMVRAYAAEKWDGNLAEILNVKMSQEDFIMPDFSYMDKPEFVDVEKFTGLFPLLFANQVYIDNKLLDGFLDHFLKKDSDCQQQDCSECGYCSRIAKKTVKMALTDSMKKEYEQKYEQLFANLADGTFFAETKEKINWPQEMSDLLDQMIQVKPEFIQTYARNAIKEHAEKLVRNSGRNCVEIKDLIDANVWVTPKEMQAVMLNGLQNMGLDVSGYLEEVFS